MSAHLLEVNDLKKHYGLRVGFGAAPSAVRAVDGVSFTLDRGETLSIVGESGCGKSTVGRAILRLVDVTSGQVVLDGRRIDDLAPGSMRALRRRMQVVFQDPFSSLNPRMRVRDILAEPLRNFGIVRGSREIEARVAQLLDTVRLPRDAAGRFPHEFSGGQRQRIGIARALAPEPDLIIGSLTLHLQTRTRRRHTAAFGMGVSEAWQGRGVGTALLAAACEHADQWWNVHRLELEVYTDNEAAVGLYRKFGFEIEGTHRDYAFRAGEYVDAHTMARVQT